MTYLLDGLRRGKFAAGEMRKCPLGFMDIDILLNRKPLIDHGVYIEDIFAMALQNTQRCTRFQLNKDKGACDIRFSPLSPSFFPRK